MGLKYIISLNLKRKLIKFGSHSLHKFNFFHVIMNHCARTFHIQYHIIINYACYFNIQSIKELNFKVFLFEKYYYLKSESLALYAPYFIVYSPVVLYTKGNFYDEWGPESYILKTMDNTELLSLEKS